MNSLLFLAIFEKEISESEIPYLPVLTRAVLRRERSPTEGCIAATDGTISSCAILSDLAYSDCFWQLSSMASCSLGRAGVVCSGRIPMASASCSLRSVLVWAYSTSDNSNPARSPSRSSPASWFIACWRAYVASSSSSWAAAVSAGTPSSWYAKSWLPSSTALYRIMVCFKDKKVRISCEDESCRSVK